MVQNPSFYTDKYLKTLTTDNKLVQRQYNSTKWGKKKKLSWDTKNQGSTSAASAKRDRKGETDGGHKLLLTC